MARTKTVDQIIEELEKMLVIDEHELDSALEEHPDAFYQVSRALAQAISVRDAAKRAMEETEARVDLQIRRDADVSGTKTTEAGIKAELTLNAKVKQVREYYAECVSAVGKLQALMDSFRQRSYAISSLVELHTAGYFSVAERRGGNSEKNLRAERNKAARQQMRVRGEG